MEEPDLKILEGSIRGDRKCQEMLYRHFYRYGISVCLRYTSTREEAVEVLNDGFFKVFNKLGQFDREKSFKAWFRKILINTSVNYFKKHLKHRSEQGLEMVQELSDNAGNVFDQLAYDEILDMIRSLSPVYRTIFNLYVMEGYKHEEIAKTLQISEGASRSGLSRARANLRQILTKRHGERLARLEK